MAEDVATVARRRPPHAATLTKAVFFSACLALEALVFAAPRSSRFAARPQLYLQACVTGVLLVAILLARRSQTGRAHAPVLYAFFVGSTAVLLSTMLGDRMLEAVSLVPVSPAWIALSRLSEAAWRVTIIVLLMLAGGASLRSMYLTRGRLGFGLAVGLAGFAVCAAATFLPLLGRPGGWKQLSSVAPWILTFVLANGFAEELLFRGLFLQRFERFLGKGWSNLLAAGAFTLWRLQAAPVSELAVLLLVLFPLALFWGWLMQKSGGLWGSALFHAGIDCLVILG